LLGSPHRCWGHGVKCIISVGARREGMKKSSHDEIAARFVMHYLGLPLPGSPVVFPLSNLSIKQETGL